MSTVTHVTTVNVNCGETSILSKERINKADTSQRVILRTLISNSLCSRSICKTITCPAVPATTNMSLTGHRNILCTPRRGSSVYGSKWPILRNGGHSSSSSAKYRYYRHTSLADICIYYMLAEIM